MSKQLESESMLSLCVLAQSIEKPISAENAAHFNIITDKLPFG